MNQDELLMRQQQLRLRSTQLRLSLAGQTQVLTKALAWVDQARSAMQWLQANPQWPAGLLLAIIVLRTKPILVWGGRIAWAWTLYQRAKKGAVTLPW